VSVEVLLAVDTARTVVGELCRKRVNTR